MKLGNPFGRRELVYVGVWCSGGAVPQGRIEEFAPLLVDQLPDLHLQLILQQQMC
jgi:hypothetical protein